MKSELRVKIDGLNLSRIIDYLISQGVLLNNLKIKSKYVVFSINQKDVSKLDNICKIEHKKYFIISKYGICNIFVRLRYCLGSIFACLLICAYLISYQSTIFKINITNETDLEYDLNKVRSVLENNDICVGSNKFFIKRNEVKDIISNNLNDISNCSVYFNGLILNIKIYPEQEKYQVNNEGLYSKYDAVITEIEVYSGKSDLKTGSVVKEGDLLVSVDDGAQAKVKGKVYFSEMKLFNERQEKIVFTGNVQKVKNVYFCNKKIIKQEKDIYFSNYLTKKCEFYICDNYLLPIKVEEILFLECDIQETLLEFKDVESQIKTELYSEVIKKIPETAEIINTTYSIVRDGEYVRVDCFVETIIDLV